jgi:alpha/beta superfamily hydrolase
VTTVARAFGEAGASTFRFNFRGVGATEGAHDEGRGETEDALAVIAHARSTHAILPLWLPAFLRRRGGGEGERARGVSSIWFSWRRRFAVLTGHGLGEAPDPNDRELGEIGRHALSNTVIVHGDRDETVILADSIAWATPREVPIVVVPGADHFFHRKLHVLREAVARWVK